MEIENIALVKTNTETYKLYQCLRKPGMPNLFKRIALYFNCYGTGAYSKRISVTHLFLKIADGELDIIDPKTGKAFWSEEHYEKKTDGRNCAEQART